MPSTTNPLGVKGAGEAGAIGAPPAVIGAMLDALRPLGVEHIDMPATPSRVWEAIQRAQANGRVVSAVIGAGPAGLMAAEVMARGGARVTVFDRMPAAGRKFLLAGRGGLNLTHSEPLERVSRPLRRGDAAAARRDRGVSAGPAARLVRGARAGDVRRLERAGVPEAPEGVAAVARLAQAARCGRRRVQAAPSLDRLERRRRADVRDADRAW